MSFKLKTLVVFDTNSVRSLEAGDLAYRYFSFGKSFEDLQKLITGNNLQPHVTVAVSELVIEELKIQKSKKYIEDIERLKGIAIRLAGMPHVTDDSIKIPAIDFDCRSYVEEEAKKFIQSQAAQIIPINDNYTNSMLRSMIDKVMQDKVKAPFKVTGKDNKIKDAGFKDNVIWESLMHYEEVANFDKVLFVTDDTGFDGCEKEFIIKWNKHIKIIKNHAALETELRADYSNYMQYQKVYEFAAKEYFDDYLKDLLNPASAIQISGKDLKIENYQIKEHCLKVETIKDEEGDFVRPVIISSVSVFTTNEGEKTEINVMAKTTLSDFEYIDIEETQFEPNIY
jgi:hypothetical protein